MMFQYTFLQSIPSCSVNMKVMEKINMATENLSMAVNILKQKTETQTQ